MVLNAKQMALCEGHGLDFSGLSALFLNCTLKPTGTPSHTEMLKSAGGLPNHGNDCNAWKAGCRFDYENPEHRS